MQTSLMPHELRGAVPSPAEHTGKPVNVEAKTFVSRVTHTAGT